MASVFWILYLCVVFAQSAVILFEGRIPKLTRPADFDKGLTPYNPKFVRGQNQTWSDLISTENMPSSMLDGEKFGSFGLTITSDSIFVPGGSSMKGFRRSELLPKSGTGLTSGVTTFHFSLMKDMSKPLNLSHEYQLVFIEPNDGTHVFEIKYGTGYQNTANPSPVDAKSANQLRLMSSSTTGWDKMKVLFQTEFTPETFHNFAITIDWNNSILTAHYSKGRNHLYRVVAPTPNPTKPGEFHVGMVKLPVGPTKSVAFDGIQENNIIETLIYGGIFVEDTSSAPVTTRP